MKNEQGFSLVELLIVVAIIAIIAAIAIPSLLTSRMAANEAAAIQGCRTIGSAEIAYSATNNQQYAAIDLLSTQNFLDSRFSAAANIINGYTYDVGDIGGSAPAFADLPSGFHFLATPQAGMGRYIFGIGPDQVVRYVGFQDPATALPPNVNAGDQIGKSN